MDPRASVIILNFRRDKMAFYAIRVDVYSIRIKIRVRVRRSALGFCDKSQNMLRVELKAPIDQCKVVKSPRMTDRRVTLRPIQVISNS